jgi:ribosomal RNA-processing protein 8
VPLPSASVDVVVFCLSLMGTNMMDFIQEARRLLVDNGIIKVCVAFLTYIPL